MRHLSSPATFAESLCQVKHRDLEVEGLLPKHLHQHRQGGPRLWSKTGEFA
jgi:hypothetical protein